MNKAVIFLNGDKTDVSQVKKLIDNQTLVIGCDGGTKHAIGLGITPHIILGDMDSIFSQLKKELEKKKVKFVSFPTKKDNTDAELALQYAIIQGCNEIILTGILGTRIDHMLATIHMLANPKYKNLSLQIIERNQHMYIVWDKIKLTGKKGDLVSFIPLNGDAIGITTQNLAYSLQGESLRGYETLGISNVMTKNTADVSVKKGALLVTQCSVDDRGFEPLTSSM